MSNNGKGNYVELKKKDWSTMIENDDWTTFLAYQLQFSKNSVNTLLKYEALLTQCSYLSRMAYCPADIFCRMTEHLDVTPDAFNNYIRAIEKIYDKLFNYKCSYDSTYIQSHDNFIKYFNAANNTNKNLVDSSESSKPIGYFIRNDEYLNVYLYIYPGCDFNNEKTLFITFKGGSSVADFLKTAASSQLTPDKLISELDRDDVQPPVSSIFSGGNGNNRNIELAEVSNSAKSTSSVKNNVNPNKAKTGGGFFSILKPSIKELCDKIEELQKNHSEFKRVIITGHSQGGGIASLFGYYLRKYKLSIIDNKPIHIVTFGACCVFDAPGRNEFNKLLNIQTGKPIFTLDRVTVNGDPVIKLPVDLDHPGYTLLKNIKNIKAYSKTGRTNEIGEIREMLGLTKGYDGNDLLLLGSFVKLFKKSRDFMGTDSYDVNLYRSKFKIPLGSKAEEQQLILTKAMPDAKEDIKELFKEIKSKVANKIYNNQKAGGFINNFKNKRKNQGSSTNEYKRVTLEKMPNQINYNCYKIMTMGFCHGAYMGVSYMTVLRIPGLSIKNGYKPRKEPTKNYTLYEKNIGDRTIVFSKSEDGYNSNTDCSTIAPKKNNRNNNSKPKSFGNKIKNSFSGITGLFKSKEGEEEKQPNVSISKCSIL
jgi:hypothetical protein